MVTMLGAFWESKVLCTRKKWLSRQWTSWCLVRPSVSHLRPEAMMCKSWSGKCSCWICSFILYLLLEGYQNLCQCFTTSIHMLLRQNMSENASPIQFWTNSKHWKIIKFICNKKFILIFNPRGWIVHLSTRYFTLNKMIKLQINKIKPV